MPRRRPTRSQRTVRRRTTRLGGLAVALAFTLAGCSSTAGLGVFAPYRGALLAEEYRSPPTNDSRFTQPPTYPSHLLKPVFKQKDDDKVSRPVFGGGSGGPGGMPMQ